MNKVTLFYDSSCPLCLHEVRMLERRNKDNNLALVDLHDPIALSNYPDIDGQAAMDILHAQSANGEILLGLDATHAAWTAVGLGYISAPLRWPLLRHIADFFYRLFVSRRYTISRWLTGSSYCSDGACSSTKSEKNNDR